LSASRWPVFVHVLLLGSVSQATADQIVRIAPPAGVSLRERPSASAVIINKLDVGDGVSVLRKVASEGAEWAYVKVAYCVKGNRCADDRPGWVRDEHLAYEARFKPVDSWKKRTIGAGVGDFWFTMDINPDGSLSLKFEPYLGAVGDTGECPGQFTKDGRTCVAQGRLFRYGNFIWAKGVDQYFFVNDEEELCSVYSGDDGTYCTKDAQLRSTPVPR
jgi:hypothetical protein